MMVDVDDKGLVDRECSRPIILSTTVQEERFAHIDGRLARTPGTEKVCVNIELLRTQIPFVKVVEITRGQTERRNRGTLGHF